MSGKWWLVFVLGVSIVWVPLIYLSIRSIWRQRDLRFANKLCGKNIESEFGPKFFWEKGRKHRIDVAWTQGRSRLCWLPVADFRKLLRLKKKNQVTGMSKPLVVRIALFPKGKSTLMIDDADTICLLIGHSDPYFLGKWTGNRIFGKRGSQIATFLLQDQFCEQTPIHGPKTDCTRCDDLILRVLNICETFSCVADLALSRLREEIVPILGSTKGSFGSPPIAACREALEKGIYFIKEDANAKIVLKKDPAPTT